MGIVFLPLYMRILGSEAYGVVGAFAVLQACLIVLDGGFSTTINRETARLAVGATSAAAVWDLLRTLELVFGVLGVIITLSLFSFAPLIAERAFSAPSLQPDEVKTAICLMGVIASLRLIENIYRGTLLGLQHQVSYNALSALLATVRWGGCALVLTHISASLGAFFIWQAFVSCTTVVTLMVWSYRRLPRLDRIAAFSKHSITRVMSFSVGVMATGVTAVILTQIDKVMLMRLRPLAEFGSYSFASSVAGGISVLTYPVAQAFFPRLTGLSARGDQAELVKIYHEGTQAISILTIPPAIFLAFFAPEVIGIWSNDASIVAQTAPIVRLLAIGSMLNALMVMPYTLSVSAGWPSFAARMNSIAACLLGGALYIYLPRYGVYAAAIGWILLNTGYVTVGVFILHRYILIGQIRSWYLRDIAPGLVSSVTLAALLRSVIALDGSRQTSNIISLVASGLVVFVITALSYSTVRRRLNRALLPISGLRR